MTSRTYQPSSFNTWTQRVLAHLELEVDTDSLLAVTAAGVERSTRREFAARTRGAVDLLEREVARGDAVPALLATRPVSVTLLLAGALAGRPLAPLAPRMTRRELLACLSPMEGDVLLTEEDHLGLALDLAEATGRRVVVVDSSVVGERELRPQVDATSVAFVMHTSGTTGLPKRVDVREGPLGRRADVNGYLLGLHPGDRLVTSSLFHHVGALGNIAVALGNGTTLAMFPHFSVEAWRSLDAVAPTHAVVVPSVIEILLAADALELPSMQVFAYGGSPIHPETMRRVQQVMPGVDFVNLFGQTEGSPVTVLDADDHRRAAAGAEQLLRSVGRPAPGVELRLEAPGPDGVGEIWARCPHSFVVDEQGWQHTGDLGHVDDGYLYLVGRRGDKIIRGGENVFPLEVEQVLELHRSVRAAAVVGVPDQRLGETIAAFVVATDPDRPPQAEELRAFARERLAGFKVPAQWTFVEDLPRNPSGKVLRRVLATRALEAVR